MAVNSDSTPLFEPEEEVKDEFKKEKLYETFTDASEVKMIIDKMKSEYRNESSLELCEERFGVLIDKYQEQPHLLDPHLDGLLSELLTIAMSPATETTLTHQCFKFLYKITKVRGYKIIVRHLPHEVKDLEPVLDLLSQQNPSDVPTWETRYMLLLWLSIIVMIPFHMTRLDHNLSNELGSKKPIMERILDVGKFYLGAKDKPQDAAAYLISRFITRPDVKELHMEEFINWALTSISSFDGSFLSRSGELAALALLFKHGKREDCLPYAARVLQCLLEKNLKSSNNTLLRKLCVKLIQRIGMTFLRLRVATWRYQRGSRMLEANLKSSNNKNANALTNDGASDGKPSDVDDDFDVPEEVENVIQELLTALKDKETIIRWSAAKGIGRVTNRLPKVLADEVVESVLELFVSHESDSAWHGGCLALAELGRRGLLLPVRLKDVVPVIVQALVYDEQKGSLSVGDHIRDAACYVCWAFARAYDPEEMKPYVNTIASALLITTVFDREIHCRRAASAAFQENVGRQGTFPHGIDIVTTADYFAVGNRTNAFLNISSYIAEYPEYSIPLVNHLVRHKINHWDASIRELTSLALHKITTRAPDYMVKECLPQLMSLATGSNLNTRHGSILAIAEIIHRLAIMNDGHSSFEGIIGGSSFRGLKDIIPFLMEKKLFRGLGGELTRIAACKLIEKISLSKLSFHEDPILDIWQSLLNDCIRIGELKVVNQAVSALTPFCSEYYNSATRKDASQKQEWLINNYIRELECTTEKTRMGFCMALGSLPDFMLSGHLSKVISSLINCTKITENDKNWAKARKEAIGALEAICSSLDIEAIDDCKSTVICKTDLYLILDCFLVGLQDYTVDSCGDIGSYVRKASMCGLKTVLLKIARINKDLVTPDLSCRIMCGIAQQAVEKIENLRACAVNIFYSLLHSQPVVPHIPYMEELKVLFPKLDETCHTRTDSSDALPKFINMISLQPYTYHVLLGLSISAGGLTEHLVRETMSSLLLYLDSLNDNKMDVMKRICTTLLQIFKDHASISRVTLPVMNTFDRLLSSGKFDAIVGDPETEYAEHLFELVKQEISKCSDMNKIISGTAVLCDLVVCAAHYRLQILSYLSIMLCHRYPRIRRDVASKLFTAVVSFDGIVSEESLDEITVLLTETDWGDSVEIVRPIRNQLCDHLKISRPKQIKK